MKKILFSLILSIATSTYAFTLNGTNSNFKGWASGEVKFNINSANCPAGIDVKSLMEQSFAVWNDVPTSNLKLSVVGTTASTTASDPVTVYCVTTLPAPFTPADADSIPGYAVLVPGGDYASTGYLVLNATSGAANISRFNQELLKVIIAHEVGHVIGLGHSHDTNALMYYDGSLKTTLSLSQDDVDGIEYLYPRNELGSDKPLGCGMVKMNGGAGPGGFSKILSILFLMLLPILISIRLRSQKIARTI